MTPASVSDYRALARRRLPRVLFDYIDGGSYAEITSNKREDLTLGACSDHASASKLLNHRTVRYAVGY